MPTRIIDAFDRTAAARAEHPALYSRRNGRWEPITWREYRQQVRLVARGLIALGVEPRQHTTIIGFNSPEWFMAHVGSIAAGAIPAGIYTTNTPEQCQYIAEHCEARVAFVENAEQLAKFRAVRSQLPNLAAIVVMNEEPDGDDAISWRQLLALGNTVPEEKLDERIKAQDIDDTASLIYTSGTTGVPKAVMLTHRNVTWVLETAGSIVNIKAGDVVVSYLPLSHVAEQQFSLHNNVVLGATIWFAESLEKLGDVLKAARPHHFLAVPRVWEKMQAKIEAVGAQNPPLKKKIAKWAREQGLAGGYAEQSGTARPMLYGVANKLVFSKVRQNLGLDRARTLITGAAPIAKRTLEFFLSLGLPIYEVYGMSETTAIGTVSHGGKYRTGKAGYIMPGVEMRVAEDGEICMRGPHIFKGYFKDAQATADSVDADGWLHTGDVGEIDADDFLQITDRKKELIITAGGENIAPALVEGQIKSIGVVSQAVVIGDRRRYLSVLLTLDPEKIPAIASLAGSPARNPQEAAECARFSAYLHKEIEGVNQRLARVQTVKKFAVLPTEFSIENGELTPTMKMKRKVISQKYAAVIERLYTDPSA
jgi:long-subunit acyl-CoA synthetase (AMP-forming)